MSVTKAPRPRNVLMGEFEGLSKEDASQALRDAGGDLDRARALVRRRQQAPAPQQPQRARDDDEAASLALARQQQSAGGPLLAFELHGGIEAGRTLMNRVQLCSLAENLGAAETLITHPASMTHGDVPREQRERLAAILFDHFRAPALFFGNEALLSLLNLGCVSGCVVWAGGDGPTRIVPVYEGHPLHHAAKELNVGGRQLTALMFGGRRLAVLVFGSRRPAVSGATLRRPAAVAARQTVARWWSHSMWQPLI